MVRDFLADKVKPETRELCQHSTLVGNALVHDHVERREAIGRHDEQLIVQFVNVANLASGEKFDAGKMGLQNNVMILGCHWFFGSEQEIF
jgi:hypothetical protein